MAVKVVLHYGFVVITGMALKISLWNSVTGSVVKSSEYVTGYYQAWDMRLNNLMVFKEGH